MHAERERNQRDAPGRPVRPAGAARNVPAVRRAVAATGQLTAAQVMRLQQTAGNAAVVQRLAQDQDQHAGCGDGCGHAPHIQRSTVANVLNSAGRRFDGPLRKEAESVYGVDLSHLVTHTDAQARQSARDIGAEAYTHGNHMVFDGAMTRRKVLHEVAHTIQQAAGPVSGVEQANGMSISDPHSPEEMQAAAMENASAPTAEIQRLLPAVTAPAAAPGADVPVQRMFRRSGRSHAQRERERIEAENEPRTHSRTRAGAAGSTRQVDPLQAANRLPPPRRGPRGEKLWDGTRKRLKWEEGVVAAVLATAPSKLSSRTGTYRYECCLCRKKVLSKAAARSIKEHNWYEIDHVEGIIANVHRSVDPMKWTVPLGENIYRDAEAISLADANAAGSQIRNLRVLCHECNGGRRAASSESRFMDMYGPQWTSGAYYGPGAEQYAAPAAAGQAGPEIVTVGPGGQSYGGEAYGGEAYGGYGGQSYGGANVVTVEPGGQSYGGQGYGGQSYGGESSYSAYGGYGGQEPEDPGYDVVTVEPRRRR
ncbi:DUF4157 domain-containing protein [Streptomyces sp. NPDC007100]|uniref:eCIS core domain-containing protein n=1 Tax=Streptomyces sp. NPDC007100 TaxID=3155602 RepID=UPI00340A61E6